MPSGSCTSLSYIDAHIGSVRRGYFVQASSAAGVWLGFALSLFRIRGSEMREIPDSPALPCSLSYSLGAPVCVCGAHTSDAARLSLGTAESGRCGAPPPHASRPAAARVRGLAAYSEPGRSLGVAERGRAADAAARGSTPTDAAAREFVCARTRRQHNKMRGVGYGCGSSRTSRAPRGLSPDVAESGRALDAEPGPTPLARSLPATCSLAFTAGARAAAAEVAASSAASTAELATAIASSTSRLSASASSTPTGLRRGGGGHAKPGTRAPPRDASGSAVDELTGRSPGVAESGLAAPSASSTGATPAAAIIRGLATSFAPGLSPGIADMGLSAV